MTKRIPGAVFALALAAGLAACTGAATTAGDTVPASGAGAESPAPSPSAASSTDHNVVDVMFATMMIPHHEDAIEMSDVALAQAATQQVKDLAARIKAAQGPEIQQMRAWLDEWDAAMPMITASPDDWPSMGHGMQTSGGAATDLDDFGMGNMMHMGQADMAALQAATGVEFDKLFLDQMIVHHQGAIQMADVELARGLNPQTLALAEAIKTSQAAEIVEMQQLRQSM